MITSVRLRSATSMGLVALLLAGLAVAAANPFVYPWIEARFILSARDASETTLRLVSSGLDGALERYPPLPGVVASDPDYRRLLNDPTNQGVVPFVNEKLRLAAETLDVSDIYVMDPAGTTVASSNYRGPHSFLGRNFAFRPYFMRALAGEAVQYHALGSMSRERGFFFAAPILDGIEIRGVLVVKITVEDFEANWVGSKDDILVADQNGIIFLSSRPEYRLRSLAPLSDGLLARIDETRQFPTDTVLPLPLSASVIADSAVEVVFGDRDDGYLANSQALGLPGWHAIVLSPLAPVRQQAVYAQAFGNLVFAVLALGLVVVFGRRARLQERQRVEATQRIVLERMVQERTADLDAANASLKAEISERQATEDRLRRTQKDLVQAGKLAALGQMSAAISHEINQPLSAVRSFADNAQVYLDRDRKEEASANLTRISAMADRMAKISGHLRNFARRPGATMSDIPASDVIEEAIALMEPQTRKSGCEVAFEYVGPELWVAGGRLRLQQVIVNIMTNALDAMRGGHAPKIDVTMEDRGDTVAILLRDTGPGLSQDALNQAFDAFFTTKEAGSGLGLGLSISYNIIEDFGGHLSVENHPEGGALFTVELRKGRGAALSMVAE